MKSKGIMLIVVALAVGTFLFSGCAADKAKQLQGEVDRLNQVIQQKDAQIRTVTGQLDVKEKELSGVKEELDNVKKELNALKQNVGVSALVPAPQLAPAPVPIPAPTSEPAPASTPAPESSLESASAPAANNP